MGDNSNMSEFRIAVIGDIHNCWDERDVSYFNESAYDLLLFVGDLPGRSHRSLLKVARAISEIKKNLLLIPGNHDAVTIRQLWAELTQNRDMIERNSKHQERQVDDLGAALGPGRLCGYSIHPQRKGEFSFDLIACRPHSMGGDTPPGFLPYLTRRFGVDSMEASAALLRSLVDRSDAGRVLFLAHNGPTGLGGERSSIFGRDFNQDGGDFGDPDLAEALAHARSRTTVLGVVAGHMHHRCKGGGVRPWLVERDGIFFLNSARVPRVFRERGESFHHHIEVRLSPPGTEIFEVLVNERSEERTRGEALPV